MEDFNSAMSNIENGLNSNKSAAEAGDAELQRQVNAANAIFHSDKPGIRKYEPVLEGLSGGDAAIDVEGVEVGSAGTLHDAGDDDEAGPEPVVRPRAVFRRYTPDV